MRKEKYIDLIIKRGVNLKKDETLVIRSDVKNHEFVKRVVKKAYEVGAKEVIIRYEDEVANRLRGLYANDEIFDVFPKHQEEFYKEWADNEYKSLSIVSPDPKAMDGVEVTRLIRLQKAAELPIMNFRTKMMSDKMSWSIAAIPSKEWADVVFKDDSAGIDKLWEQILNSAHITENEDPCVTWDNHVAQLHEMSKKLNDFNFEKLHYSNSLGTDLTIKLPIGHIWCGGGARNIVTNDDFAPNIPTEEVFTLGDANGVDGIVFSTKPLLYNGQIIDQFSLEFKDGKVIKANAKTNLELLEEMIKADDGASRIGEVALVPYNSPISLSNVLFYTTLYDENASCHLALGRAYPTTIKHTEEETVEDLKKRGVNYSLIHEDFMIGSIDLNIIGTTFDGKEIQVFKDGNWAI